MHFVLITISLFICLNCFSQEDNNICDPKATTDISYSKKALKYFKKATKAIKKNDPNNAAELFKLAIELDPEFVKAYYNLGSIYKRSITNESTAKNINKQKQTREYYLKVLEYCEDYADHIYFDLSKIAYGLSIGDSAALEFKRCYDCAETYLAKINDRHPNFKEALSIYKKCKEYNDIYNYPVPFKPKPIPGISTTSDEYLPVLSPDNEIMLYTKRFLDPSIGKGAYVKKRYIEKFFIASKVDTGFGNIKTMPPPFNKGKNMGGACLSLDNTEMFITICNDAKNIGGGNCDIYYSKKTGNTWSDFKNINELSKHRINSKFWEAQPSLSSDGRQLYFTSDKGSLGKGYSDIYFSTRDTNNMWGKPQKMGANINSPYEEQSPFIHPDNKTLYFSSEGHTSIGKKDIFYSRRNKKGEWSKAYNLGMPINDKKDNGDFFVSTDGKTAFFAKENDDESFGWDVFSFPLHVRARPKKVVLMKGSLTDENGDPLKDATIKITNNNTNQSSEINVGSGGNYSFIQTIEDDDEEINDDYAIVSSTDTMPPPDYDFDLSVQKEGYFYGSKSISSKDSTKNNKLDIKLEKVEKGKKFRMDNILFETDSFNLSNNSKKELTILSEFLNLNRNLKIGIYGHTDNQGSFSKNLILSDKRAQAVKNMLIEMGINKDRLLHKGFGSKKSIASNKTEQGRKMNRRTEVEILEN